MNNMTFNYSRRFRILALCMALIYFTVFGIPSQELAHISEYRKLTEGMRNIPYEKVKDNTTLDKDNKKLSLKIEEIGIAAESNDVAGVKLLVGELKTIFKDYKEDNLKDLDSIDEKLAKEKLSEGKKKLEDYRSLLINRFARFESLCNSLESGKFEVADELATLVEPEGEVPILGSLDNLNAAIDPSSPISGSVVESASGDGVTGSSYVALPTVPVEADLAVVEETKLDDELKELADGLDGPLEIYEFVRNKVDFVPYYGSRKGAIGTYTSLRGNDYDQASFLIGLLRYKGYPARYVKGTMKLSKEEAMNWSGGSNVEAAVRILGALGSKVALLADGCVSVEHVWVEAYVPYGEYRGAVTGDGKSLWVPLDPSYKEYETVGGIDPREASGLSGEEISNIFASDGSINDDALSSMESSVETYLGENWEEGSSLGELIGVRSIVAEHLGMLPLTLPYPVVSILSEFNVMPEDVKEYVDFSIVGDSSLYEYYNPGAESSFNVRLSSQQLYGKRVSLSYVPATPEDEAIVEVYGDIFKTPVFLIDVKPQLAVDGIVVAEGGAWGNGYDQKFSMGIKHAGRSLKSVVNSVKAGDIYSVVFDFDVVDSVNIDAISDSIGSIGEGVEEGDVFSEAVMGRILDGVGKGYFGQLDSYGALIAGSFGVSKVRQGGEAMVGYSSGIKYVLGVPTQYYGGNFTIDVDHNSSSVVSLNNIVSDELGFMVASGSLSSALEHVVMEQVFQLPGVSTVRLLEEAKRRDIRILNITKENYSELNSVLSVPSSVRLDIFQTVYAGNVVSIPSRQIDFYGWYGTGYIVSNPVTGASAYRLSGGLSGGATAVKVGISALSVAAIALQAAGMLQVFGMLLLSEAALPIVIYGVIFYLSYLFFSDSLDSFKGYLETGNPALVNGLLFDMALGVSVALVGMALVRSVPSALAIFKKIVTYFGSELAGLAFVYGDEFAESVFRRGSNFVELVSDQSDEVIRAVRAYGDDGLTVLSRYGNDISLLVTRHVGRGEDIVSVAIKYGSEGLGLVKYHGVDALDVIVAYGDDSVGLLTRFGQDAIGAMKNGIDPSLISRLDELGIAPVDYAEYSISSKEAAEVLAETIELIPSAYRQMVIRAFDGAPEAITLTNDLNVYRHWGGVAGEMNSPWYSIEYYSPEEARSKLALPDGNTATNLTEFLIPSGSTLLKGKTASMVGEIGFGDYAIGGSIQIYLPDPTIAQIIN